MVVDDALRRFARERDFPRGGAVISDVDGTLLPAGQPGLCADVSAGIAAIAGLGRPVVLNTLRTPAELRQTLARAPVPGVHSFPVITLNGALSGIVHQGRDGHTSFEELHAHVLGETELAEVDAALRAMPDVAGSAAVLVGFHRDGRAAPTVWYRGGAGAAARAALWGGTLHAFDTPDRLLAQLRCHELCMLYVLDESPGQAARQGSGRIVTGGGMNKGRAAVDIGAALDLRLAHCIGAGDSSLDTFLDIVGCGVHIGARPLPFRALHATITLATPARLGLLLREFAALYR